MGCPEEVFYFFWLMCHLCAMFFWSVVILYGIMNYGRVEEVRVFFWASKNGLAAR